VLYFILCDMLLLCIVLHCIVLYCMYCIVLSCIVVHCHRVLTNLHNNNNNNNNNKEGCLGIDVLQIYCSHHEGVQGSCSVAPLVLIFVTRWMCVVSKKPRPLYPRGKNSRK